jgi:hypothetical protein
MFVGIQELVPGDIFKTLGVTLQGGSVEEWEQFCAA